MWHSASLVAVLLMASGAKPTPMKDLTFLTRDGCVNTPDMMLAVDDALTALGWPHDYQVIDIGKLPAKDVRTGYPTPTLFVEGQGHLRDARPETAV